MQLGTALLAVATFQLVFWVVLTVRCIIGGVAIATLGATFIYSYRSTIKHHHTDNEFNVS